MKTIFHITMTTNGNFLRNIFTLISIIFFIEINSVFSQSADTTYNDSDLLISQFAPSEETSVIQETQFKFAKINSKERFFDKDARHQIEKHLKHKRWNDAYNALFLYIDQFTISNFTNEADLDLLWKFARVSEKLEIMVMSKEAYRLLIKHYRGSLHNALKHYGELVQFEEPKYVELEYYYKLVERRKAIDTLRPPEDIMLNMGEFINSEHDDYGPSIGGLEDDLFLFSSDRNKDTVKINIDLGQAKHNEDIYIAKKDKDGLWEKAIPFENINTTYNEGSPCISQDRQTMIFVRCGDPSGKGDCDLYYSIMQEDGHWSKAKNLGSNINSVNWDSHPSLSSSGDTLYFASDRKGGFGGTDIYYAVKKDNYWGRSINIGPFINTKDNEVSPHLHPSYDVLYFSSTGQMINFGDFDIFKTFQVNGRWAEPKNLGPLVNTKSREYFFAIDHSSNWLFYAKKEEGSNHLDLHSFPMPMEAKPNNIIRFSGKAREPRTGEVFKGVVSIIDLDENIEVAPHYLNEDGSFAFELINNRNYLLIIEGDNFFQVEEAFHLDGSTSALVPVLGTGGAITFESVDFAPNSSDLLPEMENNLHLIIDFLDAHPDLNIKVIGHTDSDGSKEFNLDLSQRRANSIKEYIIGYGSFEPSRVIAIGVGDLAPIIKAEVTEEHKKLNRRVEFHIFK